MEDMHGSGSPISIALHTALSFIPEKKPVYFFKARAVGKIYGLLVGNERISAQDTCARLCDIGEVTVPEYLQQLYEIQNPGMRENLARSLLLTLAFMNTIIMRDPKILAKFR